VATYSDHALQRTLPAFDNPAIRPRDPQRHRPDRVHDGADGHRQQSYWQSGVGVFSPGSPMANDAGLSVMKGASPANIARRSRRSRDAGYKGEKVVLLDPADYPASHMPAMVAADLLRSSA